MVKITTRCNQCGNYIVTTAQTKAIATAENQAMQRRHKDSDPTCYSFREVK